MSRAAALAADFWAAVPPGRELPEAEQEIWRSLGAKFKGRPDTVVAAATAAAMEQLRSESLVGNRAVSKLLGVDPSRISQLTADRALYFFEDAAERCFPHWQFVGHRTLPGLRTVIAAVDQAVHPLSLTHWMVTPHVDLEIEERPVPPVEWLLTSGPPEAVADLMREL
jgi:hypothetical protein